MKYLFITLLTFSVVCSYGQDVIKGALYDYKTNRPIKLSYKPDTPIVSLSGEGGKTIHYKVNKDGTFDIPASDIKKLGATLEFSIFVFSWGNIHSDFADMRIKNISSDNIRSVVSKIFLKKAYWMLDNFGNSYVVNNKKTFADSTFIVDNGLIRYRMKRDPSHIKREEISGRYIADLKVDLLKQ
jgi:hypothetical protein